MYASLSTRHWILMATMLLVTTLGIPANSAHNIAMTSASYQRIPLEQRRPRIWGRLWALSKTTDLLNLSSSTSSLLKIRGGGGTSAASATVPSTGATKTTKRKSKTKKKAKSQKTKKIGSKKKASSTTVASPEEEATAAKKALDQAMKDKDAAQAMGDAIRERADIVREIAPAKDRYGGDPFLQAIDRSVTSVGRAMGASDAIMAKSTLLGIETDDGGGVPPSPSSVIANYFLKSHGGAHLLQSMCSLLATAAGFGALTAVSKSSPKWTLVLLRRTLIFALVKHLSGLLSSAAIAAKAVPRIGLSKARQWMEEVVRDPVSQYIFYTALLLWWLPSKGLVVESVKKAADAGAAATAPATGTVSATWWWSKHAGWVVSLLIGPILLREVISTMLVISDVMVLWSVGSENDAFDDVLRMSQSVINAGMSLLVSPKKWRTANPSQRQAILASLVSKVSMAFEGAVGVVLVFDLLISFFQLAFGVSGGGQRPSWYSGLFKLLVVRLYLHYMLWIRRFKYAKLATELRGGAAQLPFWILDTLYDPPKAFGIKINVKKSKSQESTNIMGRATSTVENGDTPTTELTWMEYFIIGFGLEEEGIKKAG